MSEWQEPGSGPIPHGEIDAGLEEPPHPIHRLQHNQVRVRLSRRE